MAAIDDLKAAFARVQSGVGTLQSELSDDAQQIKDLTAKLAAMPPAGTSDADVEGVVAQINALADGLAPKVDPVVQSVQQATPAA